MRELKFLNPKFNDDLNLTVRNGTKWSTVEPGEKVALCSVTRVPGGETSVKLGTATVFAHMVVTDEIVNVLAFHRLILALLPFEHAEDCRTVGGLYDAMQAAYPPDADGDRSWGKELTFLFFVRDA